MKNLCSGCNRNFGGVSAFDLHRLGSFYRRERRCMSDEEMVQKGLIQKINGSWSQPISTGATLAWVKEKAA